MSSYRKKLNLTNRFRRLLPIIVDVETTGLNYQTDGLLEISAVAIWMDSHGKIHPGEQWFYAVEPFMGAYFNPDALAITGIDPYSPLRYAISERQALHRIFSSIQKQLIATNCHRAVLVGHNAWFDLLFILEAAKRAGFKKTPFHSFTTFDTASLAAVALKETVLAKALRAAKISFNVHQAHAADYDAAKTAELFCYIVNESGV